MAGVPQRLLCSSTLLVILLSLCLVIESIEAQQNNNNNSRRGLGRGRRHDPSEDDEEEATNMWQDLMPRVDNRAITRDNEFMQRRRKKCDNRIQVANGRRRILEQGALVRFRCEYGYLILGARVAACIRGQWSEPPPVCIRAGCRRPQVTSGMIGRPLFSGAAIIFECLPGFQMEGESTIFCNGVRWNGTAPTCQRISPPTSVPTAEELPPDSLEHFEENSSSTELEHLPSGSVESTSKTHTDSVDVTPQQQITGKVDPGPMRASTPSVVTTEPTHLQHMSASAAGEVDSSPSIDIRSTIATSATTTASTTTASPTMATPATTTADTSTARPYSPTTISSTSTTTAASTMPKTSSTPSTTSATTKTSTTSALTTEPSTTSTRRFFLITNPILKPTASPLPAETTTIRRIFNQTTPKPWYVYPSTNNTLNATLFPKRTRPSSQGQLWCYLQFRTQPQKIQECLYSVLVSNVTNNNSTPKARTKPTPPTWQSRWIRYTPGIIRSYNLTFATITAATTTTTSTTTLPSTTKVATTAPATTALPTSTPVVIVTIPPLPGPDKPFAEEFDNTLEQGIKKSKAADDSARADHGRELITPFKLDTSQGSDSSPKSSNLFATFSTISSLVVIALLGSVFYYCWTRNKGIARRSRHESDGRNLSVHLDLDEEFVYFGNK